MKIVDGVIYEGNITLDFVSHPDSVMLSSLHSLSPRILSPSENFNIYMRVLHGSSEIAGLSNVYAELGSQRHPLNWNSNLYVYSRLFTAPSYEGVFSTELGVGYQKLADERYYVIDTSKPRSADCPLSSCENRQQVRECVHRHKTQNMYSEGDVISCIESGWVVDNVDDACILGTGNRGDWNNDCMLTGDDATSMTQFLNRVTNQEERNSYASCGDMNNDGMVDSSDLECLTRVASSQWEGDKGDGTCDSSMKGGFCLDIKGNLPGDLDGSGAFTSADVQLMDIILNAVSAEVTPTERVLYMADMNRDGVIDNSDKACIQALVGGPVATSCLRAFNYGCTDTKGDLNRDGIVDDFDRFLLKLAVDKRIPCDSCADLNNDDLCDELDLMCIDAIIAGNSADMEEYCISCQEKIESVGGVYMHAVCNDGLDNDCSGMLPEEEGKCYCGPLPCDRVWDTDGIPHTMWGDWAFCFYTSWGERTVWGSEMYASGNWGWHKIDKNRGYNLEAACAQKSHIGRTAYCSNQEQQMYCAPTCSGDDIIGAKWVRTWELAGYYLWVELVDGIRCFCGESTIYQPYEDGGVQGQLGMAKQFGSSYEDYAAIDGDMTVLAWVNPSGGGEFFNTIAATEGMRFQVTTGGILLVGFSNCKPCGESDNCKDRYSQIEGGSVPSGVWTFVGFTRSGDAIKLYVNGEEVASGTISLTKGDKKPNTAERFRIGGDEITGVGCNDLNTAEPVPDYFRGALDDVVAFSSALDADKIKEI